jgi:hypothetical protein
LRALRTCGGALHAAIRVTTAAGFPFSNPSQAGVAAAGFQLADFATRIAFPPLLEIPPSDHPVYAEAEASTVE